MYIEVKGTGLALLERISSKAFVASDNLYDFIMQVLKLVQIYKGIDIVNCLVTESRRSLLLHREDSLTNFRIFVRFGEVDLEFFDRVKSERLVDLNAISFSYNFRHDCFSAILLGYMKKGYISVDAEDLRSIDLRVNAKALEEETKRRFEMLKKAFFR